MMRRIWIISTLVITILIFIIILNNYDDDKINTQTNNLSIKPSTGRICNQDLLKDQGISPNNMIELSACTLLNQLEKEGIASGNADDSYDNRDNRHINFCVGWTPNPDCPQTNRLFPQHNWIQSGTGRAIEPQPEITIGQASYRGKESHGIAYVYYENQQNAEQAYQLYTHNNLYIYPSLGDDSFTDAKDNPESYSSSLNHATMNIANTPYIIASKQIAFAGTNQYHIHDASGSELPFVELAFASLASLKPEVKQALAQEHKSNKNKITFLIPTLQMLIRYSHKTVNSNEDYLTSPIIHQSMYMAHKFINNKPAPAYDAERLIKISNALTLSDIPPLIQLTIISETFSTQEKLFTTPGAIARTVKYNTPAQIITISASQSLDINDKKGDFEYRWELLNTDSSLVKIKPNPKNNSEATITFNPSSNTERLDVGVFIKNKEGKYYSVPGIISFYIHP